MKKVSCLVCSFLLFSFSKAYCISEKEQKQRQADDKLKEAYVDTAIGSLETIVGSYKMAQGDITGAFTVGDGVRHVINGIEEFKKACEYNREAREMKEDE